MNSRCVFYGCIFILALWVQNIVSAESLPKNLSNNQQLLFLKSKQALQAKQLVKAKTYIIQALKLQPDNADYYFQEAIIQSALANNGNPLLGLSRSAKALKSFKKAISIEPDNIKFLQGLMGFYLLAPTIAGGDNKKAQLLAKKIVQLHNRENKNKLKK